MTYNSTINIGEDGFMLAGIQQEFPWWDENGLIPFLGSLYGDMSILSEVSLMGDTSLKLRWERTNEVFKLKDNDFGQHINSIDTWVKQYITCKLKGDL